MEPAVHRYLDCGIFDQGVARIRCPDCRHEFLVAFSCKLRGLCPSCHQKRELMWVIRYWGWYANAARGKRRKKTEEGEQASPEPGREDAVDAFTRQARLTWAKLIRRVYEIDPLLCPFCGSDIGTRRRRRRGGAAASSAASLWAGSRLHHRLRHRPSDPPQSEAAGPTTRASSPRATTRDRAPRPDSLRLLLPRSATQPDLGAFASADSWGFIHSVLTTHPYRLVESGPIGLIAQLRSFQLT